MWSYPVFFHNVYKTATLFAFLRDNIVCLSYLAWFDKQTEFLHSKEGEYGYTSKYSAQHLQ